MDNEFMVSLYLSLTSTNQFFKYAIIIQGSRLINIISLGSQNGFAGPQVGLFPSIFNLAEGADIHSNATCGDHSSEVFCKLELNSHQLPPSSHECAVCDLTEPSKAHSIRAAVDGDDTWWQAPSLQFGSDYHFVTITLDFKKVSNLKQVINIQIRKLHGKYPNCHR